MIPCTDPATGASLGEAPVHDATAVAERVARARRAQEPWARTSFRERRRVLRKLLDAIVARQEEIARACARDSGKTLLDAALGEIVPVCEKLRWTIRHGERWLRPERRPSGLIAHKRAEVRYEPLGVVGVIAPWNFPFHNLYCPMIPALFAGNAVVTKVSEHTTWSSQYLVTIVQRVLADLGHSPDLLQLVTGYGETGAELVRSGVEKIFFTGSPQNGRRVMEAASAVPTPVVLELGGKDPMIVLDDADLDRAVASAMMGVFTACGQMCVGVERIYVVDAVHDTFVERLRTRAAALRQGPTLTASGAADVDVGAMTMPRQLEILEALIGDAVAKGARVLVGGNRNTALEGGQYFQPTVLVDVDHSMRITQEEQFGPLAVVIRVRDEQHAIQLANDCPYGLGSSVFTRDPVRAERVASRIRAGMCVVNDYGIAYMVQSAPFGGAKISGVERINGPEGLRACCHVKTVLTDRWPSLARPFAPYPVARDDHRLVASGVTALYGRGPWRRLSAATRLAAGLIRRRPAS